jgi:hypothetical protein
MRIIIPTPLTFDFSVTLLDDGEGENSDIGSDNAAPDGLLLLFSSASWSVAFLALPHEDSHSSLCEDALSHGETLLVVATSNPEDVTLELIAQGISLNLLPHSAVKKYVALVIVVDFKRLLPTSERVSNVELQNKSMSLLPSYFLKIDLILERNKKRKYFCKYIEA